MKRILAMVLSVLMAASVFTGCGGSKYAATESKSETPSAAATGKKVSLDVVTSYGGDDGNRKNYEAAVKAWEQKTGNTIRDSSGTGNEDWKVKVMNSFEVGSEPDVLFFFNGADSNKLVKNKKVVSIDEIRKQYPDYAKNMREDMLGASPVDGKNYSIPVNGYWESMFVNTKVLKDCGITVPMVGYTYDQFLKDCEIIKNKGYTPIAASLAEVPNYWFEFLAYNYMSPKTFNTMPQSVTDDAGKAWINGLNDLKELFEKGYFPKNTNSTTDADTNNLMAKNKAAFMIDGSWKVGWFEENMKEDMDGDGKPDIENIDVVFPPVKGSTRASTDYIGGISMGYFITTKAWNNPEKRDACVDFVSHMTQDDVVSTFCSAGSISALKNGVTSPSTASPLVKKVNEMNKKVTGISAAVEDLMDNKSVRTPFFADVKNMVTGKLDITKAVGDVIAAQKAFEAQTSNSSEAS
ncbi:MAG: Multiple sugar-binding protein [Eubacteriales bacterium]